MNKKLRNLKVVIIQDYLHVFGGAEGVANAIYELFPQADIYTATYDKMAMEKAGVFKGAKIFYPKWRKNIKGKFGFFIHKLLIANLPIYFYTLNLKKYDLVISSTAHFAKGIRTTKNQLHISYIHTPPRFLYGYEGEIRKRSFWYWKALLFPVDIFLKAVDKWFAKFPDYIVCNSKEVQMRIKRIYSRDAVIINPFPNLKLSDSDFKQIKNKKGGYYLSIGRLQSYKNVDLIVKTCGKNNIPLKIAGMGNKEGYIKNLCKKYSSVEFLGFVSNEKKKKLLRDCEAFIGAVKDEDFGMAPLEAMLYGKPVIVLRQGGYLETVKERKTGIFFDTLNEKSLLDAITRFKSLKFDPDSIRKHALGFSKERFKKEFKDFVVDKVSKRF